MVYAELGTPFQGQEGRYMRMRGIQGKGVAKAALLSTVVLVGACSPTYRNHGYIPAQEDLDTIEIGTDSRETVAQKVGVPTSAGVLNNSGYYYVRKRTRAVGPLRAQEIDRQVVAISFSEAGRVQNIERFGLEKGRVVPLQKRVTESAISDRSFIRQLLGNLGRFNPAGFGS